MIKIGDRSTQFIESISFERGRNRQKPEMVKVTGTVVYVHERNHWYTVEFRLSAGSFRESYWMGVE